MGGLLRAMGSVKGHQHKPAHVERGEDGGQDADAKEDRVAMVAVSCCSQDAILTEKTT